MGTAANLAVVPILLYHKQSEEEHRDETLLHQEDGQEKGLDLLDLAVGLGDIFLQYVPYYHSSDLLNS